MLAGNMHSKSETGFTEGSRKYYGCYEGIVKENSDFQRMGRLGVWVPELGTKEDDPDGWIIASYASPFAGATNPNNNSKEQTQTFDGTQRSYGFWAVPPDPENIVLIQFINGEPSRAYWFACVYQQYTNNMIPNVPASPNYQYGEPVPSAEYNRMQGSPTSEEVTKPYHRGQYEAMRNQGLSTDSVRGYSQNGASSSPSSKVMGMLTPLGHYWSMEDTPNDSKIRIRSANGVQLLLDDTRGLVYINNKTGSGWIEIDEDGKIMLYSDEGIGVRSAKDISFTADKDFVMEAGRNIIMKAGDNIFSESTNSIEKISNIQSSDVGEKRQETIQEYHVDVKNNYIVNVKNDMNFGNENININSNSEVNITSGADTNLNVGGSLSTGSSGDTSISSNSNMNMITSGKMTQSSSKLVQNSGGSGASPKSASPSNPSYSRVPNRPSYERADVYQPKSDGGAMERKVNALATVYPTHEPNVQHGKAPDNRNESADTNVYQETDTNDNRTPIEKFLDNNSILKTKDEFMQSLMDDLRRHEGVVYRVYADPLLGASAPTAGIGHLLSESERAEYSIGDSVTEYKVEEWFREDAQQAIDGCKEIYSSWSTIPDDKKEILVNMCFNLGQGGLSNFSNMNSAVENRDWDTTADEMINSAWYNQVGSRAVELSERMRQ